MMQREHIGRGYTRVRLYMNALRFVAATLRRNISHRVMKMLAVLNCAP